MFGVAIFIGLIATIALLGTVVSVTTKRDGETTAIWGGATIILGAITGLLVLFSSFATVGTQNVGIETSFGKPVGDISNGFHLTAPWVNVTEMNNAVQTDIYEGKGCITVRIAEQQTACAQVRIRWQMRQSAADQMFRQYQTPDNVRTRLVASELYTAMNDQFDGYNPVASVAAGAPRLGSAANPTVPEVAKLVTAQMRQDIGGQINVYKVLVPNIAYDATVQDQLNKILAQKAKTAVALEAEQTAADQARAAQNLAKGAALTPGVLQQNCYNIVAEAMAVRYPLPASWSCGSPSNVSVLAGR